MRISCNQFQPDISNPANQAALEKELSNFIDHLPIIALCTARLSTAGTPEIFDAPRNAQPGILRQQGQWIVFGSPEQIKTHGEIKELNESFTRINRKFSEIPEILKYLVTILSVSGSLIIAHWLNLNGITTPTSIFFCGIMLSTWYGGARQGVLAIALSLIDFKFYFVPQLLSFSVGDKQLLRLFIFTFSAVFVVWFCAVQRNISNSLKRTRDLLNSTVQKLRHTNMMLKTENAERNHAEKLLHAREQEFRLACQQLFYHFENTPLGVIEFDKDLVIKQWSKRAEEIFGWTAAEALGKSVYDADFRLIYNEDKPSVDSINLELTGGLVNRNMSMNRNYTKQGNTIYCEWYNSVLRNEQGHVTTILSLAHDVSERALAEQNLNRSHEEITRLNVHLKNITQELESMTRG
jgi:PAS domain S-box-containing protein